MLNFWRDLSVSKKLYAVVGVMAVLIATELFTLLFAMNILSSVRSFVGGEGLWSKGQKNAVHALHRYAFTSDPKYYAEFYRHLEINMGDRAARVELSRPDPDLRVVTEGFRRGENHPDDIPGLISLIQKFYWVDHIERALIVWNNADTMIDELITIANNLDRAIQAGGRSEDVNRELIELDELNERLTIVENEFSQILGAGSRWLENLLMIILVLAVLTVESTGVLLTIAFSRNLNRSLKELTDTAAEVGRGNFGVRVPVHSHDELGQLAVSINKMTLDLENSAGQRDRAQSASLVKSQFLANMSHEIRTPLGVILGLTEILKDPKLTWQEQMGFINTIERTGKNLTRIINDILDLSKVEAGHMEIQRSDFAFREFMTELEEMLKIQADKTGNKLSFHAGSAVHFRLCTDRTRLRQILVNLVNNALKYTKEGLVEVIYRVQGDELIFDIVDSGVGIPESERARIFEPFVRSESASDAKLEGTGLGLMLSKRLARALGGDVTLVHSQPGEGSVFRATIRAEIKPEQAAETSPAKSTASVSNLNGRQVLVVEDSEDNQLLVKLFLSRAGVRTHFASNGKDGLDQALQHPEYDAILMDMQMPVMDGYRATEELRARGYDKPIIALTAHAMKEDREKCLRVGCSDYLTKPIDSRVLAETIARHL